jgi:hypothetical protein
MHPIEFKKKWELTYSDLAFVLGYSNDFTVRCWAIKGKNGRKPQGVAFVVCRLLDEKWSTRGKHE